MNRRKLLAWFAGAIVPSTGAAQTARKPRVGILSGLPKDKSLITPILLKELAAIGYRDGETMQIEFRSADGAPERYPALARELFEARCDVIIPLAAQWSAQALKDARVPVVLFAAEYDPVEIGLVKSLARPGGHITGAFTPLPSLINKNLEIATEIFPKADRFLVLADSHTADQLAVLRAAAAKRKVALTVAQFDKRPYDLAGAFELGRRDRTAATIVLASPTLASMRRDLSDLLLKNRVPSFMPDIRTAAESGVLIAYGVHFAQLAKRVAVIADKVLKGGRPADIPVEQVNEFELLVNMRIAKALGVKIPYSVLARATSVIE